MVFNGVDPASHQSLASFILHTWLGSHRLHSFIIAWADVPVIMIGKLVRGPTKVPESRQTKLASGAGGSSVLMALGTPTQGIGR